MSQTELLHLAQEHQRLIARRDKCHWDSPDWEKLNARSEEILKLVPYGQMDEFSRIRNELALESINK